MHAVLLTFLLAATPCEGLQVGVLAIGSNARAVITTQARLEKALADTDGLCVTGAAGLAPHLSPATPTQPDARYQAISTQAAQLLDEAKESYYRDKLAQALDRFGALRALYDRVGYVPTDKRIQLYLWRTAVYLAMEDESQATAEVTRALTANPKLVVDLKEFRPSVGEIADVVRGKGIPEFKVKLRGLPKDAKVRLDDRSVGASFSAPTGKHWLIVEAPHRKTFSKPLNLTKDRAIRVPMQVDIDAPTLTLLNQFISFEVATVPEGFRKRFTDKAGLNALLVAQPTGDDVTNLSLLSMARDGSVTPVTTPPTKPGDGKAFLESTQKTLTDAAAKFAKNAPAEPPPAFTLVFAAGSTVAYRTRSQGSADGRTFTLPFVGTGPRIGISGNVKRTVWSVDASFLTYDLTEVNTGLPNGDPASVKGGSTIHANATGGYRFYLLDRLGKDSPWLQGGADFTFENHSARDFADAGGELGLISSFQRIGVGVEIGGGYPFRMGKATLLVGADGRVVPLQSYKETPANSGLVNEIDPEFAGDVYARFIGNKWAVELLTHASFNEVRFVGDASAPFDPVLQDVRISQVIYTATLTAQYTF